MDSPLDTMKDLKLSGMMPTGNESYSRKVQDTMITDVFEFLKSGDTEIKLDNNYKNIISILGESGNGKSMFTRWITEDNTKLISREIEEGTDEFIIEDINDPSTSTITSDTLYPQLLVGDGTSVFCDNPGFNDTRNENEIATAYFIKKIMTHADRVKLIFVINYHSVRKGVDRQNFMKLVKNVADFIKNIEKFRNSIALIVTKVDNLYEKQGTEFYLVNDLKVITSIANFLEEVKEELEAQIQYASLEERRQYEVGIKFISILLAKEGDQFSRIGIFRRPDQPGPLSEIPLLQEEKQHIKRLIYERLFYSDKENDDFGYAISENCKMKIYYLVKDIDTSLLSSLCRVKEEISEYYTETVDVIQNTVKSILDETSVSADLQQVQELSYRLKDGCCRIFNLREEIRNVKCPEDFAKKINAVIGKLNIDTLKHDLMNIEKKGKHFSILQTVSDRQLSIKSWHEKIFELYAYMSNVKMKLQGEIDVIASKICKQMESDFQTFAKTLQEQFDNKTKSLDIKEAAEELNHYRGTLLKITEAMKSTLNVTGLLKIVCDFSRDINISLPKHNVLNVQQQEKNFMFLKAISETEINFSLTACVYPFENVVKHLIESETWYRFLDKLYFVLSQYKIQLDREKYNVLDIEDWGNTGRPEGIVVTKNNFKQFLRNISDFNVAVHDDVQNIDLTDIRLYELNQLLNETLKHRIKTQCKQSSVFIEADYISVKEVIIALREISEEFKFLRIFALRKVFIDEDMSFPGVELSIIAPKWEIIGNRNISLDGIDGEPHSETKAGDGVDVGSNGKDGKPGMPGKPGGIFLGIGESFLHETNLTVTVNGGKGGPGQHGGNGRDGEQGKSVGYLSNHDLPSLDAEGITNIKGFPCEHISCESGDSVLGPVQFIGALFPQNPLFKMLTSCLEGNTLYKIIGSPGQAGGIGGNGGIGGRGGSPGIILIVDFKKNSKVMTFANKGEDGVAGKGGNGGKNGETGLVKFAMLRAAFEPISGVQVPDPGVQVPDPGVQVPTNQTRNNWIDQIDLPGRTVAKTGLCGTCGLNSEGLKVPESPNAMTEPFKTIGDYKIYARQNLKSRFEKDVLLNFIALLEDAEIESL